METFRTLLAKAALGNGISSTAYDTAWVAKLGQLDDELSDLALNWLCERQLPDGSWGAEFPFCYEDRLLSTLAAMISLTSNKHVGGAQRKLKRLASPEEPYLGCFRRPST